MKLATVRHEGRLQPGFLLDDRVYLLDEAVEKVAGRTSSFGTAWSPVGLLRVPDLERHLGELADVLPTLIERGDVTPHPLTDLGPPVPRPGKIICIGRNYAQHARETGSEIPTRPILFAKFATAVTGPFDDIVRPTEVTDLDYEAELCAVIGTAGRHIPKERALEHVVGYCCANDISARTAQLMLGDQWLRGKSFDTFCPIGPAIVTRDEVGDPQALRIRCRVDGEVRQDDTTGDMIFDVATLVSYCSDAFTLEPGDLMLTGTPAGVALGRDPPPWLQPGQRCEVEIERVGAIANRVVDEAAGA